MERKRMGAGNEDSSSTPLLISFHLIFLVTCCTHLFLSVTGKMENSLLLSLMALLLLGVGEGTFENSSTTATSAATPYNNNSVTSAVLQTPPPKTIYNNITEFVLIQARVKKESPCSGQLYLYYLDRRTASPLCFNPLPLFSMDKELCKDMRCGDFKGYMPTKQTNGVILASNRSLINSSCYGLQIICEDTQRTELAAYKAITGILIFLILGVIFVRFSQPTYKAIRKRFSQKRQSRWVGPTQSQSVSYHRGQGPPNNNTLKRQSFPGLERLTVNASREPSSNRNSDYDSYGFN